MTCDGCGRSFPAGWLGRIPAQLTPIGSHRFCEVCLRELSLWFDKYSFQEILKCLEEYEYYESVWKKREVESAPTS